MANECTRVFVWEIAVKIPSQKTHLWNLYCDFPDDSSRMKKFCILLKKWKVVNKLVYFIVVLSQKFYRILWTMEYCQKHLHILCVCLWATMNSRLQDCWWCGFQGRVMTRMVTLSDQLIHIASNKIISTGSSWGASIQWPEWWRNLNEATDHLTVNNDEILVNVCWINEK